MQTRTPRFFISPFVTPVFALLLLSLCLHRAWAQETTFDPEPETLIGLQRDTTSLALFGRQGSPSPRMGVESLSAEAQQLLTLLDESNPDKASASRIRKCLERLQKLQTVYTTTGRLDEAFVLRENIEEFQARQAGIEPDPGNLTALRDQVGKTHTFRVMGQLSGSVWGSGVYTDDSALSAAAVHAGLLRDGQRGVVKVTLLPGQEHYEGSEANGITSSSYETWQGSYILARVTTLTAAHNITMPEEARKTVEELTRGESKAHAAQLWPALDSLRRMQEIAQQAQELDQALAIREGTRALIIKLADARPAPGQLTSLRGQNYKSFYFVVTGRVTSSIWGSGIYTDDSDLGTAVVHAGLLRPGQTGIVKVTIRPGCDEYEGSENNGVVSGTFAAFAGSYQVYAFRLPSR